MAGTRRRGAAATDTGEAVDPCTYVAIRERLLCNCNREALRDYTGSCNSVTGIEVRVRTRSFLSFALLILWAASTAFGQKPTPPPPPPPPDSEQVPAPAPADTLPGAPAYAPKPQQQTQPQTPPQTTPPVAPTPEKKGPPVAPPAQPTPQAPYVAYVPYAPKPP